MSNHFSLLWPSDLPQDQAKEVVRANASAWGWKQRKQDVKRKKKTSRSGPSQLLPAEASPSASTQPPSIVDRIPPPVTSYEPQNRLFTTFLPRFKSLIGPDSDDWINRVVRPSKNETVWEAYNCLIVGVCSNLVFDAELRKSAIQRYGSLLPKVQARVNDPTQSKGLSTSCLIFLLGIEEAMVWKSFRNSQTHIAGWARLVELRGPQSFTSPGDLFILRMFRMNAVAMHLLQRRRLFLASHEWRTIPWSHTEKDLFDHAYDLLVQIPCLVANVDDFKTGVISPAQMDAEVRGFISQLNGWVDGLLFPIATSLTQITEWNMEKIVRCIGDGTCTNFVFARGLTHYLAAILLVARFGQRYETILPLSAEEACRGVVTIVQKHALDLDGGALWPWIQPLRIAHFSPAPSVLPDLVALCVRLERRFSWSILQSERYELYSKGNG